MKFLNSLTAEIPDWFLDIAKKEGAITLHQALELCQRIRQRQAIFFKLIDLVEEKLRTELAPDDVVAIAQPRARWTTGRLGVCPPQEVSKKDEPKGEKDDDNSNLEPSD